MLTEIVLFAVGIIVGIMNSIAGGGMLVGFPVLVAAGMTPLVANITANVVLLPGQITSAYGYRKFLRKLPPRYLLLLLPCLVGAVIGALLLRRIPNDRFQQLVPALILFAVLLFAFQPFLHRYLHRHISQRSRRFTPLMWIGLGLLPTAVYGGFFGAGFGFIMLAFLGFAKLHDIHQMNGLKNLAGMTIATVCIISLYSTHLINWPLGLAMAAGNSIGGYVGARYSQRFSSHIIRIVVIIIGFTAAAYLAFRTY